MKDHKKKVDKEKQKDTEEIVQLDEVSKLKKDIEEKTNKASEYYDLFLRTRAEFDNFRRRGEKEKSEIFKFSQEVLVKELVKTLDNFELALNSAKSSKDFDSFHQGVEMIYKGLNKILAEESVVEIKSKGSKVDPHKHEVVSHEPDLAENGTDGSSDEEDVVIEVIRKGYLLNDRVLRPALVKVGKRSFGGKEQQEGEDTENKDKEI